MNVVLVGGGGREHALAWRIAQSPTLSSLVFTHDNPGFDDLGDVRPTPIEQIPELARSVGADLVVVGPEGPLAAGLADRLAGIPCFGPSQAASCLETSKSFAKEIMLAAGVPTAGSLGVDLEDADSYAAGEARSAEGRVVVKADGLAAGKGVVVCESGAEAVVALREIRARFGDAARHVLLEDLLVGPEVSLFALCDGTRAVPLLSLQDHKRLLDGDLGPNTGGMGAYGPCPLVDERAAEALCASIHAPVLRVMSSRGTPFRGLLYAGLMLTPDGPRVLEFNVRFGDPETQPLMALWEDDILPWLHGAAIGALPTGRPRFRDGSACGVVLAAQGYPDAPRIGDPVPNGPVPTGGAVFYAGVAHGTFGLLTAGGRVLCVTGVGATAIEARASAYQAVPGWAFTGAQWRRDIAVNAAASPRP